MYNVFLDKIHPFLDGNGRTCKILFEHTYKIYEVLKMIFSYEKQLILQTIIIILFVILADHVDCVVNNSNIFTDGRWRCYEMGQRICHRIT